MAASAPRLLDYLLENGLAPDERSARGLIMRGDVLVDERPVTSPAAAVAVDSAVRIRGGLQHAVSRGYDKLAPVLDALAINPAGRSCMDLGASTGGFTQLLLERGAAVVYAVDVAYGVLAEHLRHEPRLRLLERTNARELNSILIPEPLDFVTGDLSFISWAAVMPAVASLLGAEAELLLLVKPQFELASRGRGSELEAGIVASSGLQREALLGLWDTWQSLALCPCTVLPSPLKGQKGNQEYFVHLSRERSMCTADEYSSMATAAVGAGTP